MKMPRPLKEISLMKPITATGGKYLVCALVQAAPMGYIAEFTTNRWK
jgi:hypothetical protein